METMFSHSESFLKLNKCPAVALTSSNDEFSANNFLPSWDVYKPVMNIDTRFMFSLFDRHYASFFVIITTFYFKFHIFHHKLKK